jgi:hypothetical protein
MPWFKAVAEIEMSIEAEDLEGAKMKAETILNKRVVGCSFGFRPNDQGEVICWNGVDVEPDTDRDDSDPPPGPNDCPDCGDIGESRGHMGCRYPCDDPNIEGLEDPMMYER